MTLLAFVVAWCAALVAGCVVEAGRPSDGPVFDIPPSIAGDCSLDVTDQVNAWIRSVPNGDGRRPSVLNFGDDRCYRVDGTLRIEGRNGLTLRGSGSTLDQSSVEGPPDRPAWLVRISQRVVFTDFNVIGAHETKQASLGRPTEVSTYGFCEYAPRISCEYQPGWAVLGSSDVLLSGNTTTDTYGDSVLVMWDYPISEIDSSNVVIERHRVAGAGRQGIAVVSGVDIVIRDSTISGVAQQPIDIEPEDARFPVRDVRMTGNRFGQSYASIVLASGRCAEVRNVVFTGNEEIEPNITSQPSLYARNPCSGEYRGDFDIRSNLFWVDEYGDDGDTVARFEGDVRNVNFEGNRVRYSCVAGATCSPDEPAIMADRMDGWRLIGNSFPESSVLWSITRPDDRTGPISCANELRRGAGAADSRSC